MNALTPSQESQMGELVLVPVMGDRMSPRLRHNQDAVYYIPSGFMADDIYVADLGGCGVPTVTRVQAMAPGQFRIFGDNPNYPDRIMNADQLRQVLLGVVVCEIKVRDREIFRRAVSGRRAA